MKPFVSPRFSPRLGPPVAAPESDVLTVPKIDDPDNDGSAYRVILYNDDYHDVDQVIDQVMKACECDEERATEITAEAHFKGRAVCYKGGKGKCHKVAKVLREIRLQCEVDSDD